MFERENTSATEETEAWGCRRCWGRGMLAGEEVELDIDDLRSLADGLEEVVRLLAACLWSGQEELFERMHS